ncbi:MAG: permease [Proteobacteria bacterium]|nr:permease [Pseudomonadota bacterium]
MDIVQHIIDFIKDYYAEFISVLPYFIAGVASEAIIRTFKWHIKIKQTIHRYGALSVVIATILGLISPLCACGVLPLSLGLLFAGVPFSIMMTLVISSPLLSPAGYTLTQWELGTKWALAKTFSATFMGLYAGFLTLLLEKKYFKHDQILKLQEIPHDMDFHDPDFPIEELRCSCHKQFSHTVEAKTKNKLLIFFAKFYEGTLRIGKYVLIGIFFEILILKYVPAEWISKYLSEGSVKNIFLVTIFSIPLYVNQITASAMLYSLVEKGISNGSALAFLIGGPVTAIPVMAVFFTMFKKRVIFYYLFVCITGTMIVSLVYQWFFS